MDLSNVHKWPLTLKWQPSVACLLTAVNGTAYGALMLKEKTKYKKSDQAFLSNCQFYKDGILNTTIRMKMANLECGKLQKTNFLQEIEEEKPID